MKVLRNIKYFLFVFLQLLLFSGDVMAENRGIAFRTGIQPMNISRFVLETSEEPDYQIFYLDSPRRIVLDVKNLDIASIKKETSKTGFVSDIRVGNLDKITSRFVLDLNTAARVKQHFLLKPLGGNTNYRIVVDIESAGEKDFGTLVDKTVIIEEEPVKAKAKPVAKSAQEVEVGKNVSSSLAKTGNFSAMNKKSKSKSRKMLGKVYENKEKVIVIDAGHGGEDPGAIGLGGTYEKHIVLAMAKQLRDVLAKNPEYKIILTRDTDVFIKLQDRAKIAEKNNAAIFISVHADSSPKKTTKGFTVYTLSERATDEESKKIAEKENAADLLGIGTFNNYDVITKNILGDLMQTQVKIASVEMANQIVSQVKQDIVCVDNPHREAPFIVLRSAIPSVLIEMGFLSNMDEERKLNQKWYREKLAYALARAVGAILKD